MPRPLSRSVALHGSAKCDSRWRVQKRSGPDGAGRREFPGTRVRRTRSVLEFRRRLRSRATSTRQQALGSRSQRSLQPLSWPRSSWRQTERRTKRSGLHARTQSDALLINMAAISRAERTARQGASVCYGVTSFIRTLTSGAGERDDGGTRRCSVRFHPNRSCVPGATAELTENCQCAI